MQCDEIVSRDEARSRGLKRYFTGLPCKHGHLAPRQVYDTKCADCVLLKNRRCVDSFRIEKPEKYKERRKREWQKSYAQERVKLSKLAHAKKYRKANRAVLNAYQNAYRDRRREWWREYSREWSRANGDKRRVHGIKRRVRLANAAGSFSASDIRLMMAQQKGKCAYFKICGTKLGRKYHIDHIIALVNGGTNFPSNLQLLCPRCNLLKHTKDPIEFSQTLGLLL